MLRTSSQRRTCPTASLTGGQSVRFEMRPKDKTMSLGLPAKLREAVCGEARRESVPYQRFIARRSRRASQSGAKVIQTTFGETPGVRLPSRLLQPRPRMRSPPQLTPEWCKAFAKPRILSALANGSRSAKERG